MKQRTHWGMVLAALLLTGSLLAGAAVAWLRAAAGALAGTVLTATVPASTAPAAARPAAQTELPEGYWYGVTLSADTLPGELPPGPRFALHENAGPPGSPAWRLPADPAVPPGPARALTG